MINLITPQEFASYRNVSKKLNTSKIEECIRLAQAIDLQDILGEFFFDLLTNYEEEEYADLMSGSTFTISGKSFIQDGVKSLLADLTYVRYLYTINTNDTSFGMVQKLNDDSAPVDRNMIKDLVKVAQQDASFKFRMIDKYLCEKSSTFIRYNTTTISDRHNDYQNITTKDNGSFGSFTQNFWVKK